MKQILVIMAAVVGQSVMADGVVFKDRDLGDQIAKKLFKPHGKFAPPPKFTEAELAKVKWISLSFGFPFRENNAVLKELVKLPNLRALHFYCSENADKWLKEVANHVPKLNDLHMGFTDATTQDSRRWLSCRVSHCLT